MKHRRSRWSGRTLRFQRGQAMAATVVALPVLGALIGAAIQLALLFENKSTLNHATLQAARAGMVGNGSFGAIVTGLTRGMVPLYYPSGDDQRKQVFEDVVFGDVVRNTCARILNPTLDAVQDHAGPQEQEEAVFRGSSVIKHDDLHLLDETVGSSSGVSIQDANLLKLYVVYGARMQVPIIGPLITRILALDRDRWDPFELTLLRRNRLPIVASATVRMQSDFDSSPRAVKNNLMISRQQLNSGALCEQDLLVNGIVNAIEEFFEVDLIDGVCLLKNTIDLTENVAGCSRCIKSVTRRLGLSVAQAALDCASCVNNFLGAGKCLRGFTE